MSGGLFLPEPELMDVQFSNGEKGQRPIGYREQGDGVSPPRDVPETRRGERVEWFIGDVVPVIVDGGP